MAQERDGLTHALACECGSKQLDVIYKLWSTQEERVAKALGVSEIARIARAEVRYRQFLLDKRNVRSKQAATAAERVYKGGGSLANVYKAVKRAMARFPGDVERGTEDHVLQVYRLAKGVGIKKATGKIKGSLQYSTPNFTELVTKAKAKVDFKFGVADQKAVEALSDQTNFWLGEMYGANVDAAIKDAVQPAVLAGLGRADAGKRVRESVESKLKTFSTPQGFRGTAVQYFEGVSANATTYGRVAGHLRGFSEAGITRYTLSNPNDDRTSQICIFMDGKVFEVRDGMNNLARVLEARTPNEVRAVHPWAQNVAELKATYSKGGSGALASGGFALPPFHFRCRTTVDVENV